ncbi:ribonuclease H-like domain-containing protein [Cercophora newfieldiana]|uniref:Ribonuclease H-like domain-containing protein n=1 Tax=Cercophora newfieldiana TaxID=92897 RepID=A0AA39Y576_9PEZI|nr:ribonuclease H-like domain-containing protein [Cercophora newfieldiana]
MEGQVQYVNRSNFWSIFPGAIEAISSASFVSFDLEMTGVNIRAEAWTEDFVQDLYQQGRAAAQIFNILQVGISCATFDEVAEAFNFDLTPMLGQTEENSKASSIGSTPAKKIDRTVSFSSDALIFLKTHGFNLEKTLRAGIPYLSRAEAEVAQKTYNTFQGQSERRQRQNQSSFESSSYSQASPDKPTSTGSFQNTTSVEKKTETKYEDVVKQTAFSYVIEALVGGDFADDIDPHLICGPTATERALDKARQKLEGAEAKLKDNPPVVIGHNPLFDLCFLYETFIGRLPADLGDRNLQELYREYKREQFPAAFPKPNDIRYEHLESIHQAGFNSFMTMIVFLKASFEMAQLEKTLCAKRRDEGVKESRNLPQAIEPFAMLNPFNPEFIGNKTTKKSVPTATGNSSQVGKQSIQMKEAKEQENGGENKAKKPEKKTHKERRIPDWDTEFWAKYGNKIRMGKKGGVLNLDNPKGDEANGSKTVQV